MNDWNRCLTDLEAVDAALAATAEASDTLSLMQRRKRLITDLAALPLEESRETLQSRLAEARQRGQALMQRWQEVREELCREMQAAQSTQRLLTSLNPPVKGFWVDEQS